VWILSCCLISQCVNSNRKILTLKYMFLPFVQILFLLFIFAFMGDCDNNFTIIHFVQCKEHNVKYITKRTIFLFQNKRRVLVECDVVTFNAIKIHNALSRLTLEFSIPPIEISYISNVFCEHHKPNKKKRIFFFSFLLSLFLEYILGN